MFVHRIEPEVMRRREGVANKRVTLFITPVRHRLGGEGVGFGRCLDAMWRRHIECSSTQITHRKRIVLMHSHLPHGVSANAAANG